MRRQAWIILATLGVLAASVHFLVPLGGPRAAIYLTIAVCGMGGVLVGVRWHRPEQPLPWYLFAVGLSLFLVGDGFFYFYKLVRHVERPFPSPADAFYLLSYPFLVAGLMLLIRRRDPGRDRASLIDAAIVATGMGLLSWVYLLVPSFVAPGQPLLDRMISVAYPLMDVLLLAVAARLAVGGGTRRPAFYLMGLSILSLLAADVAYAAIQLTGSFDLGTPFDAGWMGFYLFWGVAALHPSMGTLAQPSPPGHTRIGRVRLFVLGTVVMAAPAVLAVEAARGEYDNIPVIAVGSVVLFLLVLGRVATLMSTLSAALDRERTFGKAAAALVAATDRTEIHEAVLAAAVQLADEDGVLVRIASCTSQEVAVVAAHGGQALSVLGATLSAEQIPQLLSDPGAGVVLGPLSMEEVDGDIRQRLGLPPAGHLLVVPVLMQDTLSMAIVVASESTLDARLANGLETLSSQLTLALESAALTEALHVRQSETRFRSLVQNSSDVITVIDADTTVRYQTPSVEEVLGYEPSHMLGTRLIDLVHPEDTSRLVTFCNDSVLRVGMSSPFEVRMRRRDGAWLDLEMVSNNLLYDTNVGGIVLTARDVSERKSFESQLTHKAFHDDLTGLANRALLSDRVRHALARRKLAGEHLAVMFLDVDDFKTVNDSLGHAAGDTVLVAVAERLATCLRPADTTARLGGDEFAVLLEDTNRDEAIGLAERIITTLHQPLDVDGVEIFVGASVGIAMAEGDQTTPEELLRNADLAMYLAKSQGKGLWRLFEPGMHAAVRKRLDLNAELQRALAHDDFVVYYQTIVDLATRRIVGVEALVRWMHPERGIIAPAEFMPMAEETGLIVPLGLWVLEEACRTAKLFSSAAGPVGMSVNLSQKQLQQPGLVDDVSGALERSGIAPSRLTLEITESVVMEDAAATIAVLNQLRGLGMRLAIDDFGTGYSSLSYLRQLPIDVLKLDKEFVDGIASGSRDAVLPKTVVELANTLGLHMVAEGIETEEQLDSLRRWKCELGQGYLFAKPVPADALVQMLRREPATLLAVTNEPRPFQARSGTTS
ncbi:MAG TPA: EAL domain-containing protein [Acidimicrobiales bacterium]|nr:EAL domain-containing protein [Acidimicrobiales bacterium]